MTDLSRRALLVGVTALPIVGRISTGGPARTAAPIRVQASIQDALDAAQPGDTVEVPEGTYHETLHFPRSGTADAPITLRAEPGATVVIDGADPGLQSAPSGQWAAEGGGLYRTEVPFGPASHLSRSITTWVSRYQTAGAHQCDRLLATYASLDALVNDPARGEGTFRDGTQVYVKLDGSSDPNGVGLNIARYASIIDVGGRSHIRIEGLELRNAGWAGIIVSESETAAPFDDVVVQNVVIRNCFRGIAALGAGGTRVRLRRIFVANGMVDDWIRAGAYTPGLGQHPSTTDDSRAPWRGHGLMVSNCADGEIADCLVTGHWDGVKVAGCDDVRVHHCTIRSTWDDAIELESAYNANVEVFNNHLYNINVGISVTSDQPGPIYVYRNVLEGDHDRDGSLYSIKSGVDSHGRAENVKFYHNTFYAKKDYNVWEKLDDAPPNLWQGYDFVNNIFYTAAGAHPNYNFRGAGPGVAGENHWESNVYNISRPAGQLAADWGESELVNANAPWEAHDLINPPAYVELLGSVAVPAAGGAVAGQEFSFSTPALAAFLETLRATGTDHATFILLDTTIQPGSIRFASKEHGSIPPASLVVELRTGGPASFDQPVADTYVMNADPNENFGAATAISLQHSGVSTQRRLGYLRYWLGDQVSDEVLAATLTLRLVSMGATRTASTIELYGLSPDYIPAPGEDGFLTLPDLASHFLATDTDSPHTPRDLRVHDTSPIVNSGSDHPAVQGWPDSVSSFPGGRNRGAWETGMAPSDIGSSL